MAFAYLGLAFGGAAIALLRFTHRLELRLGLAALMLSIVLIFIMRRRFMAERTARVLAGESIPIMTTKERQASKRWYSLP